jgi:biotin transport system substrate-specific component
MSTSPAISIPKRGSLADLLPETLLLDAALVVGAACFIGLLAQFSLHLSFTPVPVTGQTLGVLLSGTALGWRRGGLATGLYVLAGIVGVPWYASHAHGWSVVSGASGGYLVGFIVAGALCGWLAERGNDRTIMGSAGTMVVGNIVIYAFGAAWLAHSLHLTIAQTMSEGVTPFYVGDLIKIVLASMLLPGAWYLVGRRGSQHQS